MRSLLGRFHRPFARGVDEQLLLLNNLGDGSTLSLDFTTGVLDPRLTFTRGSNATFINSSGYVQFANANLMTYSNPRQTGTAWAATGTVTWGSSTLTDPTGGSAAQSITFGTTGSAIFNTTGTTVVSGITHTFSVWMRAATGTTTVRIGDANVAPVATVTLTTTWQRFSCQYTTSGTNDGGAIFSQTGTPSAEFYVWGAQVQPGSIVGELIQTSGTINTNTPRFDYDPSTLQPRGLLIEGSASNIATYSNDFSNAVWTLDTSGGTIPAVSTVSQTGPDGASTVTRITFNKTGGTFSRIRQTLSGTASQPYTMSVWMKANTASGGAATQNVGLRIGADPAGFNCVVTTTWKRFQYTYTLSGTDAAAQIMLWDSIIGNDETADVLVYGCQIETGSGASSYIPTGASTGNRAADICYITNADYGFTTTGGTYFVEWERGEFATVSGQACNPLSTDYASGRWLGIGTAPAGTTATAGSWSGFLNATGTAVAGRNRAAVSYSSWVASASGVFRVNGGSEITGTLTLGTTPTYLMIGSASASAPYNGIGLRDFVNSRIRRIKYWPSVLPSATLQTITVNT